MQNQQNNKTKVVIISLLLLSVPLLFLIFSYYLGLFASVEQKLIEEKKRIVSFTEKYGKNFNKVAEPVFKTFELFDKAGLKCQPMAYFHNDEDKVQRSDRFSSGGCAIATSMFSQDALKEHGGETFFVKPESEMLKWFIHKLGIKTAEKFQISVYEADRSLQLKLTGHPSIVYQKAMARFRSYCLKNNIPMKFPVLQIYHGDSKFEFLMAL